MKLENDKRRSYARRSQTRRSRTSARKLQSVGAFFGNAATWIGGAVASGVRFLTRMNYRQRLITIIATGAVVISAVALVLLLPRTQVISGGNTALAARGEVLPLPSPSLAHMSVSGTADVSPTPSASPDPTLKEGMEGDAVYELQNQLIALNYLIIDEPTDYYGYATNYAVQLFQRQHGLSVDGIAGPNTLNLIFEPDAEKYTLREGIRGTDVEDIQRQLKDLGYMNEVTGKFGEVTTAAVKDFQSRNNLSSDRIVGEQTFDMLYSPNAKASAGKAATSRTTAKVSTMVDVAAKQLGKKYVLGNEGPNTFDCSGLVYYCLRQAGSNRGRYNAAGYSQVSDWEKITSMSNLKKGDLIFFLNNARTKVGHVGIYIGNGTMIDASFSNGKVVKRSCTTSYWKSHFVCGRRPW